MAAGDAARCAGDNGPHGAHEGEWTVNERELAGHFSPRISNAVSFARSQRVLLLRASNGVPLDISLGLPGYEKRWLAE